MASIPLPALDVRPPQPIDTTAALSRAVQLRSLLGQAPIQAQQLKALELENQQRQTALTADQVLNETYKNAFTVDDQGVPQLDKSKVIQGLATRGAGKLIPGVTKAMTEYEKSAADLVKTRNEISAQEVDHLGMAGRAIKQAGYDPDVAKSILANEVGQLGHRNALPFLQAIQADPSVVQKLADQMIARSPKAQELETAASTAASRKSAADLARERFNAEKPGITARGKISEQEAAIPPAERGVNEARIMWRASQGDPQALKALALIRQQKASTAAAEEVAKQNALFNFGQSGAKPAAGVAPNVVTTPNGDVIRFPTKERAAAFRKAYNLPEEEEEE